MKYRKLGKWGVNVSEICLGTWLTHGGVASFDQAARCTQLAYNSGINLFDTANVYPEGHEGGAELLLGKLLSEYPRETYMIATKVYSPMNKSILGRGLSRKHIMDQVDASLFRLGAEYIDIYQCHRYDSDVPLEETACAMNDLVRKGKILYWGVSEWSSEQLEEVISLCETRGWSAPVSNQLYYSALARGHERKTIPSCTSNGTGVLAFAPLAHGVLTGKYRPDQDVPKGSRAERESWMFDRYFSPATLRGVAAFRLTAEKVGISCAQLALAWCLRNPSISTLVVGASHAGQLEEILSVADHSVDQEALDQADAILRSLACS